jgi:hydrogenase/urease accessory protein HupE
MLLVCAAALFLTAPARAHAIGLSRGDYEITAHGLDVTLALARKEAASVVPSLDPDGNGALEEGQLASASAKAAIDRDMIEKIRVTAQQGPCRGVLARAALTEQDGLEVRARYVCPPGADRLTVTFALLEDLSHGHRHAARVAAGGVATEHLLFRRQAAFDVDRPPATANGASSFSATWGFVRMGVEHILTGYDHLLFLFALVLAGGTLRSLALAITAFTAAHSLTLGLAVLGFVSPPARFIEPAIALSVAYVGVENFARRPGARYWMTFPFGLLHGFGFAGALGEISIPRAEVPWALFSFNLGVEIGQLVWMVALGLLVAQLRRFEWFGRRAVPALSAAVVVMGLIWFVGRLYDPAIVAMGPILAGHWHG